MTESEALNMIQAKLTCMELYDLSCIEKGCDRKCDNCDYNYAQGNNGEQKEALKVAIQALEKQIPKKPMISYDERVKENWCSCGVCAFGLGWKRTIHYKYCPDCGQKLDWSDEE